MGRVLAFINFLGFQGGRLFKVALTCIQGGRLFKVGSCLNKYGNLQSTGASYIRLKIVIMGHRVLFS